ncbi:MAG: sugar ABC transporter permease [Clostridiaceae bacterium]|nr:sugar ABC transporter permease [Clostridiaceae bacterium]
MKKISARNRQRLEFALFNTPAVIFVSLAIYIPFIMSMYYSLTQWNGISKAAVFVGLDNFSKLFAGDSGFNHAAWFTARYSLLFIILVNVLAIFLAVQLDKKLRSANVLRAAFFVPYILSLVIVGFIWRFIFSQGFNALYEMTHWSIFELSWLGDPQLAFWSVLFVSIWQSIGFYIVIYIAGLQSIPAELNEAAIVDGTSPGQRFFYITLPMLAPSLTTAFFMALVNSIKVFDIIFSLTGGGPGGSTYSVTFNVYVEAFQNNNYGYGTAKALILFLAVVIITTLQLRFFKSREVES